MTRGELGTDAVIRRLVKASCVGNVMGGWKSGKLVLPRQGEGDDEAPIGETLDY